MFLTHIWLIPLLPALGATVMFFFGRKLQKATVSAVCVGTIVLAFIMACGAVRQYSTWSSTPENYHQPYQTILYTWLGTDTGHLNYTTQDGSPAPFQADAGFLLDPLSGIWLLFVTGVGMLIHIYSIGYMAHEGGYYRFFGYLNLFMFSMLTLILANNYVLMFVGWEGVGLCSYLLIGFYFHRKSASDAANKAFIVNRIGDAGFMFGALTLAWYFGTASSLCLAARCDGRSDAGLGADPRRNDGDGGRVHGGALECRVRAGADGDENRGHRRRAHGGVCRVDWIGAERYQARARLLHRVATGIHVPGARCRRVCGRRFPRVHACVLQGAALPRLRLGNSCHERRAGHAQHGRSARTHSDYIQNNGRRDAGDRGHSSAGRLLFEGRNPVAGVAFRRRRLSLSLADRIWHGADDGVLYGPANLPDVLWEAADGP